MNLPIAEFQCGKPYLKDGEMVVAPIEITKEELVVLGVNIETLKIAFKMNDLLTELNKSNIENGDLWYYLPNN